MDMMIFVLSHYTWLYSRNVILELFTQLFKVSRCRCPKEKLISLFLKNINKLSLNGVIIIYYSYPGQLGFLLLILLLMPNDFASNFTDTVKISRSDIMRVMMMIFVMMIIWCKDFRIAVLIYRSCCAPWLFVSLIPSELDPCPETGRCLAIDYCNTQWSQRLYKD